MVVSGCGHTVIWHLNISSGPKSLTTSIWFDMTLDTLAEYNGPPLSLLQLALLALLERNGFETEVTGELNKTIHIRRDGQKLGYINQTVIRCGDLFGYHFRDEGSKSSDSAPPEFENGLVKWFCQKFKCEPDSVHVNPEGRRTFLHIRTLNCAVRVLERQAGGRQ